MNLTAHEGMKDLEEALSVRLERYRPEVRRVLQLCFCSLVVVFKEVDLKQTTQNVTKSENIVGYDDFDDNIKYIRDSSIPLEAAKMLWLELLDLKSKANGVNSVTNRRSSNESAYSSKIVSSFTLVHKTPWKNFLKEEEYHSFYDTASGYRSQKVVPPTYKNDADGFGRLFYDLQQNLQDSSQTSQVENILDYIRDQLVELELLEFHIDEPCEDLDFEIDDCAEEEHNESHQQDCASSNRQMSMGNSSKSLVSNMSSSRSLSKNSLRSVDGTKSTNRRNSEIILTEIEIKKRYNFLVVKSDEAYNYGLKLCKIPVRNKGFQYLTYSSTFYFLSEVMASACLRHQELVNCGTSSPVGVTNCSGKPVDDATIYSYRALPSLMMRAKIVSDAANLLQGHTFISKRISILKVEEAVYRTQNDHRELQIRKYRETKYEEGMVNSFYALKDCLVENLHMSEGNNVIEKQVIEGLYDLATMLDAKGWTNDAVEFCKSALIYRKVTLDPMNMTTAKTLELLGNLYSAAKKTPEAIKALAEALDIFKYNLGKKNDKVIETCKNLGVLHSKEGNYERSIHYYEDALIAQMKLTGKKSKQVADLYCSLGVVQNISNNLNKAIFCYKEALRGMSIPTHGYDVQGAFVHFNLGNIYHKKEDYNIALEHFRKALDLEEDTESASKILFAMGTSCIQAFRPEEALTCFEQSLEIRKDKTFDKNVAQTILSIARVYCDLSLYDVSLGYYREAEQIIIELFGERKEFISVLRNIAFVMNKKGDHEESIIFYERAYGICRREYGDENLVIPDILYEKANVLTEIGENDEAMSAYQESLAIRIRLKGKKDKDVIAATYNLGVLNLKLHRYEKALPYFKDVLRVKREVGSDDTEKIADILQKIGLVYIGLKKHDLALQKYDEAMRVKQYAKTPKTVNAQQA